MDSPVPALEELLGHAAWVRRLARGLTRDEARADDLAQDAYLTALERPPLRSVNLRGWFARVLTNAARSDGRTEDRRGRRERASAKEEALPSAAELAGELEWQRRIAAAVLELDEPYRTKLLLHFYRGLAPAEIARRRDEPAATVRSHLKRGLDQLRARFDREHGGDRRAWSAVLAAWAEHEPATVAAASGLVAAAWLGLALLAGGGGFLAWRARERDDSASTRLVAAAPSAPPSLESVREVEPATPAPLPAESSRVPVTQDPPDAPVVSAPLFIGSVRDPDGAPIAGARLAIYANKRRPRPEPLGTGVTGPDGRFAFPIGPTDSTYLTIGAEAEGFQGLTMDPVVAENEISIELGWQVELFGAVRDRESGAPLAGVELSLGPEGSARSDAHGNYRLSGLPSGLQRSVRARVDGYASTEQEVLARGKDPQRLDLELTPGTAIEVEVFDRKTARPLAGARIHEPWAEEPWTSSAANGRFTVWVARDLPCELDVSLEGYWPLTWEWTPGEAELAASPRLPMVRQVWIQGRIADEHGARIEGDWLYPEYKDRNRARALEPEDLQAFGTPGRVRFGWRLIGGGGEPEHEADGRYRLPILPSAFPFTLKAGAKGFVTVARGPFVFDDTASDTVIDLVLERAGVIHGKTLIDGKTWVGHVVRRSLDGTSEAFSSALGSYTMPDVPAGTWVFSFRDRNRTEHLPFTLTVEAGRDYEHDFVSGDETLLGTIAGRVRSSGNRLPDNVLVTAKPTGATYEKSDTVTAAADGSFRCRVAPGQTCSVYAWRWTKTGLVQGPEQLVAPDSEGLELVLPDAGLLRLRLVDAATHAAVQPSSRSLSEAVRWWRADADMHGADDAEIDVQGGLELELALGDYQVVVDLGAEGYLPSAQRALSVTSTPDPEPYVIALARGVPVELRFLGQGEGSSPVAGHLVFLVERAQLASIDGPFPSQGPPANNRINGICMRLDDPALMNQLLTGDFHETGRARLPGLAPGHYFVKCYPDDFVFEPAEFELTGPEPRALDVRWRPK